MAIRSSGDYQEQGLKLLFADRPDEALPIFEEGARRFPGDEDLRLGLALSCVRLGQHRRAADILEELRARNPSSGDVLTAMTEMYLARGLAAQASAAARVAMDGPEGDARLGYQLGRLFYTNRRYREGLPFYERAAELAPTWGEAWFGLGACQWALRLSASAEAALRRSVELEPQDWQALQFLGCVLHDLGRRAEARKMLESVPLDAPWQKPALERLVAMAWWPEDAEKKQKMESLWRKVMGGAPRGGTLDMLEEVSRRMDETSP